MPGRSAPALFDDQSDNAVQIVANVDRGNAERAHALKRDALIPDVVALRSIAHSVSRAIDLDRERRFMTEEVEDIGPERMLPSEAEVCGTIPEDIP